MKLSILYVLFVSAVTVYAAPASMASSMTPSTSVTTTELLDKASSSGSSMTESDDNNGATPFYITAPLKGVTYARGDVATIQWSNGIDETFKIIVLTGEDSASMQPAGVSFNAEGSKGSYKWTVPSSLSEGTYAFQFNFKDKKGKDSEAYSDQFKMTGSSSGGASSSVGPSSSSSTSPSTSSLGKVVSGSSSSDEAMSMHSSGTSATSPSSSKAAFGSRSQ